MNQWLPNTALRRTPAAAPPSPVSFQTFGAMRRLTVVLSLAALATLATGCRSAGLEKYCCPQPRNRLHVIVQRCLRPDEMPRIINHDSTGKISYQDIDAPGTTGIPALVTLREANGDIIAKGRTNRDGEIVFDVDFRAACVGQTVEAMTHWNDSTLIAEPKRIACWSRLWM